MAKKLTEKEILDYAKERFIEVFGEVKKHKVLFTSEMREISALFGYSEIKTKKNVDTYLRKVFLREYAYDKFAEVFGPQGHDQWADGQALDIFLDDYDEEYPYDEGSIDDFVQMCLDQFRDQWWQKGMEMPLAWNGKVPKKS
jgi:hypothetical protein